MAPSHHRSPDSPSTVGPTGLSKLAQGTNGPLPLLPPPPAPHGPRSLTPALAPSRTPSPTPNGHSSSTSLESIGGDLRDGLAQVRLKEEASHEQADSAPAPSDKARGKQRMMEPSYPDDGTLLCIFIATTIDRNPTDAHDSQEDVLSSPVHITSEVQMAIARWQHPPVHYVYDAAAERTQQRIKEGQQQTLVNGVH